MISSDLLGLTKECFTEPCDRSINLWHSGLEMVEWQPLLVLLSNEERHRADSFAHERDTRRFVVSHAMLRLLLSELTAIPASQLRLSVERDSKPALVEELRQPIHFSLARSEEHLLIGFASRPLGVDIESLARSFDVDNLATVALTDEEREALKAINPVDRHKAVLRCWTQKEAYLKAIGVGLSISPKTIEVSFAPGAPPGLKKASGTSNSASNWFVDVVVPDPAYIGAVAAYGVGWRVEMTRFDMSFFVRHR
jgi:4'-phosphopantetheinyl transferase